MASYQGAEVFSYEPVDDNFDLLVENLTINGFAVNCNKKAITQSGDNVVIKTSKDHWRDGVYRKKFDHEVLVCSDTIATAKQVSGADCIKIDIEGCEMEMLDDPFCFGGFKKFVMEYHFDVDSSISNFWRRMSGLKKVFSYVHHRRMPEKERWDSFPFATNIWAWN